MDIGFGVRNVHIPFIGPSEEEISAVATDLIARFGHQAHEEAQYLVEVAMNIRSRRNRILYRGAAGLIKKSLIVARPQPNAENSAST